MSKNLVRVVNLISIRPTTLNAPTTTFATGVESINVNFTDNMENIDIEGDRYLGGKYIELSDIYDALYLNQPSYTLNVAQSELQNLCQFSDLKLLEGCQIILKKYDIINRRVIFRHPGRIKSVVNKDLHIISIEVSCKLDSLDLNFCEQYSPVCRAQFCDKRCGLKIKDFVYRSYITEVIDENTIKISSANEEYIRLNTFGFKSLEIVAISENKVTLNNHYGYKLTKDREVWLIKDCDKRIETCSNQYNNAINFRGEPNINDTISFSL